MTKHKVEIATATNKEEFDDRNDLKDVLDSKPATDEAAAEVVNILNGDPVGTNVAIVEMDWA